MGSNAAPMRSVPAAVPSVRQGCCCRSPSTRREIEAIADGREGGWATSLRDPRSNLPDHRGGAVARVAAPQLPAVAAVRRRSRPSCRSTLPGEATPEPPGPAGCPPRASCPARCRCSSRARCRARRRRRRRSTTRAGRDQIGGPRAVEAGTDVFHEHGAVGRAVALPQLDAVAAVVRNEEERAADRGEARATPESSGPGRMSRTRRGAAPARSIAHQPWPCFGIGRSEVEARAGDRELARIAERRRARDRLRVEARSPRVDQSRGAAVPRRAEK